MWQLPKSSLDMAISNNYIHWYHRNVSHLIFLGYCNSWEQMTREREHTENWSTLAGNGLRDWPWPGTASGIDLHRELPSDPGREQPPGLTLTGNGLPSPGTTLARIDLDRERLLRGEVFKGGGCSRERLFPEVSCSRERLFPAGGSSREVVFPEVVPGR